MLAQVAAWPRTRRPVGWGPREALLNIKPKVVVLIGLAALGAAAGAFYAARQRPASGGDLRSMLAEYDSLQGSLEGLRDRVLADSGVAQARATLLSDIATRIRATHPGADSLLARADLLRARLDSARAGTEIDPQGYAELLSEYQAIRNSLEPAERQAILDPEVQRGFDDFGVILEEAMHRLAGPDERRALERLKEIEGRIEALPPEAFDSLGPPPG